MRGLKALRCYEKAKNEIPEICTMVRGARTKLCLLSLPSRPSCANASGVQERLVPSQTELNEARKASRLFLMGWSEMIFDRVWSAMPDGMTSTWERRKRKEVHAGRAQPPGRRPIDSRVCVAYTVPTESSETSKFQRMSIGTCMTGVKMFWQPRGVIQSTSFYVYTNIHVFLSSRAKYDNKGGIRSPGTFRGHGITIRTRESIGSRASSSITKHKLFILIVIPFLYPHAFIQVTKSLHLHVPFRPQVSPGTVALTTRSFSVQTWGEFYETDRFVAFMRCCLIRVPSCLVAKV